MNRDARNLFLNIVNDIDNADSIRRFLDPQNQHGLSKTKINAILKAKKNLPERRFNNLAQFQEEFKNDILLGELINALYSGAKSSHPVLLLPLKIETRFDNKNENLCLRVYPDHLFVNTHEASLTQAEYLAAKAFKNSSVDEKKNAWRDMSKKFGTQRAAWLAKYSSSHNFNATDPKFKTASWTEAARLSLLPDRFCAYTYHAHEEEPRITVTPFLKLEKNSTLMAAPTSEITVRIKGKPETEVSEAMELICIPTGSSWFVSRPYVVGQDGKVDVVAKAGFMASADITTEWKIVSDDPDLLSAESLTKSEIIEGIFDESSKWMHDFDEAVAKGFAVNIPLSSEDFTRGIDKLVVVGLSTANAAVGEMLLEEQIDNHHYTKGLAFLSANTPTNNTEEDKTPFAETEDNDLTYDVEISGPDNWQDEAEGERRTNAHRLSDALGVDSKHFQYIEGAGHTGDCFANDMNTVVWTATGDYYLNELLPNILTNEHRQYVNQHVHEYVRGGAPLPTIRVHKQPYGILPVTRIDWNNENNAGWMTSDNDAHASPLMDTALHRIVLQFYQRWLDIAKQQKRVPRIFQKDPDPGKTLLNILAMEPYMVTYHARPFVDEGFIASLLAILRNYAFGPDTAYEDSGLSPLQWMTKWSKSWNRVKLRTATLLAKLTGWIEESIPVGKSPSAFLQEPLLNTLAWWDGTSEPFSISYNPEQPTLYPENYLSDLLIHNKTEAQTLLAEIASLALKLRSTNPGVTDVSVKQALKNLTCYTPLQFFNRIKRAEDIVETIQDDPERDSFRDDEPPMAYGVRLSLAKHILAERDKLDGEFTSLEQLAKIKGLGVDTFHDIIYTFRNAKDKPDIDRLFRESLNIVSTGVYAWVSSFANKRLAGLRAKPESQKGIHLGAYGFVENLKPRSDPMSIGYLHTPSTNHSATAAVLHNAYLSHDPSIAVKVNQEINEENPFHINLTSERVRQAMNITEGMRQGQPLAALLGYQFERKLKYWGLNKYIDDFREEYPLVAHKLTEQVDEESAEAVAARNVVDGVALIRGYESAMADNTNQLGRILFGHEGMLLQHAITSIKDNMDAVSDTLLHESVFHAVQGNYDRAGAALEACSGNLPPPELTSITTPVPGRTLTHRVVTLFNSKLERDEAIPENEVPRELAEPRISAWLNSIIDITKIGFHISFLEKEDDPVKIKLVNINTASHEQLATLPDIDDPLIIKIIDERNGENGEFKKITDLQRIEEISDEVIIYLNPRVTTGYKERININTASDKELRTQFSKNQAELIIEERNTTAFTRIDDLTRVNGIGEGKVREVRPYVTTGIETYSLNDLNISVTDFFYIAQAPLEGEQTEIEQRIARFVRDEFALPYNQDVKINAKLKGNYPYSLDHATVLTQQVLVMLSNGEHMSPDTMRHPGEIEEEGYTESDVERFNQRVEEVNGWLKEAYEELCDVSTTSTIALLLTGKPDALVMQTDTSVFHNITGTQWIIEEEIQFDSDGLAHVTAKYTPEENIDPVAIETTKDWSIQNPGDIWYTVESMDHARFAGPEKVITVLDKVSRFGIDNAFSPAVDDPGLIQRYLSCKAELCKRQNKFNTLKKELTDNDASDKTGDIEKRQFKIKKLLEAMKILLGKSFICLPEFTSHTPENNANQLYKVFHEQDILNGLGNERLQLWLQQMAEVRESVASLEDALMMLEAWTQLSLKSDTPFLNLAVAQLPYTEGRNWLGLSEAEGAETEAKPGWALSPVSVVAAMHGELSNDSNKPIAIAGLVLDSWEETIPDKQVNTSVAFQYDAPNTQPPQSLLLAVHPQMPKKAIDWTEDDLAAIVNDTIDLAKVRAVDVDAIAAEPNQTDVDKAEPLGGIMPGIYLPTDPGKTGHAGGIFAETIEEFVNKLEQTIPGCVKGRLDFPKLIEEDGQEWNLLNNLRWDMNDCARDLDKQELTSSIILIKGNIGATTKRVFVLDYEVVSYPTRFQLLDEELRGTVRKTGSSPSYNITLVTNSQYFQLKGRTVQEISRLPNTLKQTVHTYHAYGAISIDYIVDGPPQIIIQNASLDLQGAYWIEDFSASITVKIIMYIGNDINKVFNTSYFEMPIFIGFVSTDNTGLYLLSMADQSKYYLKGSDTVLGQLEFFSGSKIWIMGEMDINGHVVQGGQLKVAEYGYLRKKEVIINCDELE